MHLLMGLAAAAAAVGVMLAAWAGAGDPYRAAVPATLLIVVGMGAGITSGHLFKVVPMLVWTGRFAHLAGTPGAPRLSDLYPGPLAIAEQIAFAGGLGLVTVGAATGSSAVTRAGAVLLLFAAAAVVVAVAACVLRRAEPRPTSPSTDRPIRPLTGGMT